MRGSCQAMGLPRLVVFSHLWTSFEQSTKGMVVRRPGIAGDLEKGETGRPSQRWLERADFN